MKLNGRLIKGTTTLKDETVEVTDAQLEYRDLLEKCLLLLCKQLGISVPMWLKKNTKEYSLYRRTWFTNEQFIESVDFDRFELKFLE